MNDIKTSDESIDDSDPACISRRHFLLAGASTVVLTTIPGIAGAAKLLVKDYPRTKIGSVSALKQDVAVDFMYPPNSTTSSFVLVKLGEQAGGGVGKDQDIVAFSNLCTHMGGPLNGTYKAKHKAIGPCPLHLTTFDLSRHGMVISGHATESLPQARLEIVGDNIYVTGIMGLIYGHSSNIS